uniref:Uncharacterized protein n=1 Tax=Alexandrium andersonii TaxID=327968 RepID=A0A7S2JE39_9DINO|mmetsp:Transcript_98134/g.219872  ORF Transcript_98134/g.219872 Transcript_98134/m.219872 type:complete len:279 (+) Transcript_98134:99-935(+)
MVDVDALLSDLLHNSRRDRAAPHVVSIENRLADLKGWANGLPHYDHDEEVPRVTVAGDPMIIDCNGKMHHYWGSAVVVIFSEFGLITAVEYVACTGDRNYISDVWRHEIASEKWKYRYLDDTPGETRICTGELVDGPQFMLGDSSWPSEAYDEEVPPEDFMKKFGPSSRTFFVNGAKGTFMQGPDFGALHQVMKTPVKFSKSLITSMMSKPQEWMMRAVKMITEKSGYHWNDHGKYHKADCPSTSGPLVETIKKVQVAQFACGLTACTMVDEPPPQVV